MEEFAYLVNALLKSKVKGHFVTRSGVEIPGDQIEPLDPKSPFHVDNGGSYSYETVKGCIIEMFFTDKGKAFENRDLSIDIVKFVKE